MAALKANKHGGSFRDDETSNEFSNNDMSFVSPVKFDLNQAERQGEKDR